MSSILDKEIDIMECDAAKAMRIIAAKWNMPVVYYLSFGPLRFCELKRKLPPMEDSNLSKVLRELEFRGIVHREDYKTASPRVEYSLTELGQKLLPVMRAIETFGASYSAYNKSRASVGCTLS